MSISFQCPHCNFEIKAKDDSSGRRTRCPSCAGIIVVPGAMSETIGESDQMPPSAASPEFDLPPAPRPPAVPADGRSRWRAAAPLAPVITEAVGATSAGYGAGHFDAHDDDHDDDEEGSGGLLPHKDHPHEDLIDMTPMVDIVFFLLIFFLTTSMQALQAVMNLPTPQTATDKAATRSVAELANDSDTLMVKIQEDDTFWIDDEQVFSDQDLRVKIRGAREASAGKPLSLVVVGNADASHGAAIRVFDAGAAAGVGSISLLVQEETE